jgi:hypothetical protein
MPATGLHLIVQRAGFYLSGATSDMRPSTPMLQNGLNAAS